MNIIGTELSEKNININTKVNKESYQVELTFTDGINPIPGEKIKIIDNEPDTGNLREIQTDENGKISLRLFAGTYSLRADYFTITENDFFIVDGDKNIEFKGVEQIIKFNTSSESISAFSGTIRTLEGNLQVDWNYPSTWQIIGDGENNIYNDGDNTNKTIAVRFQKGYGDIERIILDNNNINSIDKLEATNYQKYSSLNKLDLRGNSDLSDTLANFTKFPALEILYLSSTKCASYPQEGAINLSASLNNILLDFIDELTSEEISAILYDLNNAGVSNDGTFSASNITSYDKLTSTGQTAYDDLTNQKNWTINL